ncbi:hypothetical protein ENSA5_27110 [Enhygromyxa salina]|uniref:Endo-1,4-beta-xylanase A n=1 Tax=Enhygromyxa salina TaxID=215803 RepID=A0A2S9Y7E7_9BACT|nr:hypothetical protein [Enhygromyxa salina]PRQ01029.1 hypothetical protein ENSA5_27110 [Enhygromyxa salina]
MNSHDKGQPRGPRSPSRGLFTVALLLAAVHGCGLVGVEPEEIDLAEGSETGGLDTSAEDGPGDSGGSMGGDGDGDPGDGDGDGDEGPDDSGDGDGDEASTAEGDGDGDSTGDGNGDGDGDRGCEPPTPDECGECTAQMCCDELLACTDDPECGCFLDCLADLNDAQTCVDDCNLDPETNAASLALDECQLGGCEQACG